MALLRYLFSLIFLCWFTAVYSQQDIDLHLNSTFLPGKNVLKVKRDFNDPYLWVLVQGNQVYRINSLTRVVDDYTSQFNAYSSFQFIDIAGRSQDTVFIATNSTNVLEYKKGIIKVIGAADGIAGIVNSIGIDNANLNNTLLPTAYTALIATDQGLCRYEYKQETMMPVPKVTPSRIFEMTYRNEMFHGIDFCRCYPDTVEKYDATEFVDYTIFGGEIWLGGNSFGHNLRSAFFTKGSIFGNQFYTIFANQFWATENGLFQNNWDYSYSTQQGYNHYFKGTNINKITSIYGLQSFTSVYQWGGARENLLVGTDQGLYFSNSKYQNSNYGLSPKYDFFHYDELGSKVINDICVNANTYQVRSAYLGIICEDGIWVAANDGLYLLKPDYAPYISTTDKLQAIQFEGQNFNLSELQTCGTPAVKADVQYPYNTIQWYKDGIELPNESSQTLNITQGGDYNAILYDPCSPIHFETNHLKVTVLSGPVFTFNYPDKLSYCDGSTATLAIDNNSNYQYRWYKDGVLNGQTASSINITQAGKYKLEVSACSGSWVPTKEVQVDFIKVPPPVISSDHTAYCLGQQAVLTATVPIDASTVTNWQPYQYRWYKDGVLIANSTSSTLNATQPGKYSVDATSCTGNTGTSAGFQLDFVSFPAVSIKADKPAYCTGDQAVLSVNLPNNGGYSTYWLMDGNGIIGSENKTSIVAGQAGNYTVSITSNLSQCTQNSNGYNLSFNDLPVVTLERIVNTTLCDGQSVDLKASYSGGTVKWSTGETADKIRVKQSGTFTATVTTPAGCTDQKDISVQFLPNPILAIPDATLCQFTHDQLTLTAPAGFIKYEWNGKAGGQSFVANALGAVTLTVTDQNGCRATQTINITSHCKDIHIPNTFTPNGDGINDKWAIAGLDGDQTVNVKVYARSGELVFQSQGYAEAWDGTYQHKKLPVGVYYYVINAQGNRLLSGYVTVVY